MGAAILQRRRCRQEGLPGLLLGQEVRRPGDHDRSGVGRGASGVEPAVRGEVCGVPTLDDLLAGAWEGLSVCEAVGCPMCGGAMESRGGGVAFRADASGDALHGDCLNCGARLS
jgi:hypothetical protein